MSSLPPHGGLTEPVCRTVAADAIEGFLAHAKTLPKVPVSDADLSTVYRLGDGGLSPLDRPDGFGHLQPRAGRVGHRAQRQALRLDDPDGPAGDGRAWPSSFEPGQEVALVNSAGQIVAVLEITDVYPWDKAQYLEASISTERTDHPGGDMVLKGDADKTHLLGGTIRVLPQPKHPRFGKYVLTPREVRKLLADEGLGAGRRLPDPQSAAPRPRIRPGLRAGDAAARRAQRRRLPESADRRDQGRRRRRRRAHAHLRSADREPRAGRRRQRSGALGPRGESVPDRVILLGLDIKMFYGGPKEAVMHAIYRQNFGFTDIIIGRKHADAPYHDGKPIWGDFDAQEIFDRLKGDLKIQPAAGRLRRLLRVDRPRRPDGQPSRTRSPCSFPARTFARP